MQPAGNHPGSLCRHFNGLGGGLDHFLYRLCCMLSGLIRCAFCSFHRPFCGLLGRLYCPLGALNRTLCRLICGSASRFDGLTSGVGRPLHRFYGLFSGLDCLFDSGFRLLGYFRSVRCFHLWLGWPAR